MLGTTQKALYEIVINTQYGSLPGTTKLNTMGADLLKPRYIRVVICRFHQRQAAVYPPRKAEEGLFDQLKPVYTVTDVS
jgi:hypothetical protein